MKIFIIEILLKYEIIRKCLIKYKENFSWKILDIDDFIIDFLESNLDIFVIFNLLKKNVYKCNLI